MTQHALNNEESAAIKSLERLAKKWPKTLKLMAMAGSLHVIRGEDQSRFVDCDENIPVVGIPQIPCDGGDF